ncbi:hypothetical protein [Streptomyces aureocirculatus]|uniref:hypothetical protein n=1 Tax=Streptomyces aureocirculatus TaxID=67275 RepID=UPI0012FF01E0|nr:hypothetical protein [Streptomyces aureocirculatus]
MSKLVPSPTSTGPMSQHAADHWPVCVGKLPLITEGPERARCSTELVPANASARAREWTRTHVLKLGLGPLAEAAAQIAGLLVSNAIIHACDPARPDFPIRLDVVATDADELLVMVEDPRPDFPDFAQTLGHALTAAKLDLGPVSGLACVLRLGGVLTYQEGQIPGSKAVVARLHLDRTREEALQEQFCQTSHDPLFRTEMDAHPQGALPPGGRQE